MKIAIIIRRLNVRGGAQRQALILARELQKKGHAVTVYTVFGGWKETYPDITRDLRIVELNTLPKKSAHFGVIGEFFSERRIARICAEGIDHDTDLLNPHDQLAYKIACEFKRRIRNIPSVWMMNDLPTKWFSLWREGECGGKKPSIFKLLLARIFDRFDAVPYARCQDAVTVLDDRDAKWVRKFFGTEVRVVRSGVDVAHISYRTHAHPGGKKLSVLLAGILLPHRRFEDTIDAVWLLRNEGYDIIADIIGDESQSRAYADALKKRVSELGLAEYVRFLGRVSEEGLARAYREHDVFVFPNHLQSWGLAVFEAMASGIPVIVSKTAGASEVLADGANALVVESKSPPSIAVALRRLIDDEGLSERLSAKGREFVERGMSWEKYAGEMLDVFQKTLEKK